MAYKTYIELQTILFGCINTWRFVELHEVLIDYVILLKTNLTSYIAQKRQLTQRFMTNYKIYFLLFLAVVLKLTNCVDIITTIAGSSTQGYSGDNGQATSAALNQPHGVTLDSSGSYYIVIILIFLLNHSYKSYIGNIYIADATNNRIRKVTVATGIISTIAGSSTSGSYSGDGNQATSAILNSPQGIALDSTGNSYYCIKFQLLLILCA